MGACAGSGDPIQLLWVEAGFLEKVTFLFCLGGLGAANQGNEVREREWHIWKGKATWVWC